MSMNNDITIYDIAKVLKVSPATVSRALNNVPVVNKNTRDMIVRKARDLGYRQNMFASSLRTQRTHFVGALVPQLNTYVSSNLMSGVQLALDEGGYNLIVSQTLNNSDLHIAHIENLNRRRVDGLLITSGYNPTMLSRAERPVECTIPTIVLDRISRISDSQRRQSLVDDIVRYLATKGCKHIAYLSVHSSKMRSAELMKLYLQAVADHGLSRDEELLFPGYSIDNVNTRLFNKILSMDPRPDAILFVDDHIITAFKIGDQTLGYQDAGIQPGFQNEKPETEFESASFSNGEHVVVHGRVAGLLLMALIEKTHEVNGGQDVKNLHQ
jgi:LacI family transcriptional regulator